MRPGVVIARLDNSLEQILAPQLLKRARRPPSENLKPPAIRNNPCRILKGRKKIRITVRFRNRVSAQKMHHAIPRLRGVNLEL